MGCSSYGQEPIKAELLLSVDSVQTNEVRFISCGRSIENNHPLFIIDGVPFLSDFNQNALEMVSPNEIVSISILKGIEATSLYGTAGSNGVVIINTNRYFRTVASRKRYPFKVYRFLNRNWITTQDMFNEIRAIVPGVTISNDFDFSFPKIKIRGDDKTIVIIDGVRVDATILNTLNPADIETVTVAPSVAATNYFVNN